MDQTLLPAKVILYERNDDEEVLYFKYRLPDMGIFEHFPHLRVFIPETIEDHRAGVATYEEQYTELLFQASALSWRDSFLKMVKGFELKIVKTFERQFDRLGTQILQINDSRFMATNCIPAHLSVPLRSVGFGNLRSAGEFLSHFIRYDDCDGADGAKWLSVLRSERIANAMIADFEHDRDMLFVRFAVADGGYKPKKFDKANANKTPQIPASAISLKMKYSSVRRVLIDVVTESRDGYVTRIYLQLNCPVEIRKFQRKPFLGPQVVKEGDRYRSFPETRNDTRDNCMAINESPFMYIEFNSALEETELYNIISRLHARIKLPLEFATVHSRYFNVNCYVPSPVRLIGYDHRRFAAITDGETDKAQCIPPVEPKVDERCVAELRKRNNFGLEYFIAALISRGAIVKDQILISEEARDRFIKELLNRYDENEELTMEVLERLLNVLDERRDPPLLLQTFDHIREGLLEEVDRLREIYEREEMDGYRRVRKVVLTPTRMLLVVPELLMGNRVLRKYDESGDRALRVQFRDDDGSRMTRNNIGHYLIQTTVHNAMTRGVYIADRHFVYLASSNSQMRDNGCYFFDDGSGGEVQRIRRELGVFDRSNIPKLMARMGQCFTQARECAVELRHKRYNKTFDVTGGRDSSGEPYTFSDGCGRISPEFARKIAGDLDIGKCVPSCFQIRFRGIKGVLSVDKWLSDRAKWAKDNGVVDNAEQHNRKNKLHVLFRPSQDKFHAPSSKAIEIVKYSSPTPVCLNRPFIAILDQVSGMQGYRAHTRVKERICSLLDEQLMQLAETLMSENSCRDRLKELPRRINVDELSLTRGFALTQEPFFRSLLRASVAFTISKQLSKSQIQIPPNLGRTMFGVVDETGILQYGQVFVQYTKSIRNKLPGPAAAKEILKAKDDFLISISCRVLMTKNPQIAAGDARVFDAIDVPQLRHLVDVVVFPQYGPRPHPDEMAGSDLDGDEYCVIWDEQLLLDCNEEASDFTKQSREPDDVPEDKVVSAMVEFFVDYIKQDSIGTISNAFMVNADLYGITSEVCANIAQKHSQSVDFPKTGQPPEPLVRKWTEKEDGTFLPPERAERWPDFMDKSHEPSYVSPRLAGHLFRRIRLVEDVLKLTTAYEELDTVELDNDLIYPGREDYWNAARLEYISYCANVRALLDNYGIQDEGQLFSGCISVVRNRISDREMDDMSLYNTNHMIEKKMNDIFLMCRMNFFDEFGGYIENTDAERDSSNNESSESIGRRICTNPSSNMKKKASAYYEICYKDASSNINNKRILSFPWVAWDILARIKQGANSTTTLDPLSECLSKTINRFCDENSIEMNEFMEGITQHSSSVHAIKRYCRKFKGLDKLMFVACKWGEQQELFEGRLKAEHICLLLIQFGLGHLSFEKTSRSLTFLEKTDDLIEENSSEAIDLNDRLGGLGKCFVRFMQFLSSRTFETLKMINFMHPNLGYHSILLRGQWRDLHRAATKSFYRIVLTGRFEELNYVDDTSGHHELCLREIDPFVIELPEELRHEDERLRKKMQLYSGVKYLQLRRITNFGNRVVVSAVGTMESLHRLRNLLAVKPSLNSYANNKSCCDMMSRLVYERISSIEI